jgi:hypothetical protein
MEFGRSVVRAVGKRRSGREFLRCNKSREMERGREV